jgi:hypothetical protein
MPVATDHRHPCEEAFGVHMLFSASVGPIPIPTTRSAFAISPPGRQPHRAAEVLPPAGVLGVFDFRDCSGWVARGGISLIESSLGAGILSIISSGSLSADITANFVKEN